MVKGVLQLRRESFSPGKLNAASQGNLLACQFFHTPVTSTLIPRPTQGEPGNEDRVQATQLNIKLDVI